MLLSRVEEYFRARMVRDYDELMGPLERRVFGQARERLLPSASGDVLEIGAGTGVNFSRYPASVRRVVAIDPEAGMLRSAVPRAAAAAVPVRLVGASAEELPFPPNAFDTVVATLVFCTIPDPARALDELRRVMRPGARLLMLEHVRSRVAALAALQDIATPFQRVLAGGCHLNRATSALVAESGLLVTAVRERFAAMVVEIEARRAA